MQFFRKIFPAKKTVTNGLIGNMIIENHKLPIIVKENKKAKRIILRLSPDRAQVKVTVPVGCEKLELNSFIENNRLWINNRIRKDVESGLVGKFTCQENGFILFKGVKHQLVKGEGRGLTKVSVDKYGNPVIIIYGDERHWSRRIADFLKKEARKEIQSFVKIFSQKLGVSPTSLNYKDTKSRWGSCTSDGSLSFSWRIVMAPPFVLKYLVAHEMSHLLEMNHSERFWKICKKLDQNMEKGREWLKQHGYLLFKLEIS
ncbi:M48 family metallopeptidase [Bartonella sp. DGB1]|uniref:M48 family metallopeptidase n=1 Tax=Bartonella sp. DGB1 TaxID=3239807 RepID=UPI003526C375